MMGMRAALTAAVATGQIRWPRLTCLVCWLAFAGLWAGCLPTDQASWKYGSCTGAAGNLATGTSLFADEFARAGYRVKTARTLGRVIEHSQVVVWFPDRLAPPSDAACTFFDSWLASRPGRTLIYVGRDFDARSAYWRRLSGEAPTANKLAIRQRLAQSKATWARRQASQPATASCRWFTIDRTQPAIEIQQAGGPLATALGSSAPHLLELHDRVNVTRPDAQVRLLLHVDQQPLIAEYRMPNWQQSRLLIVTNSSPLLNLGMTYASHQQLAGQLVALCGTPDRCVFLTSGARDPALAEEAQTHHLVQIFRTPPFSGMLMHLSLMGLIYCFAVYPIFGRPRTIDAPDQSDFGRHVEALGRLLAKTHDSLYAQSQRHEYQHKVAGQIPESETGDNPFGEPS